MLVLTRKAGERIIVDESIAITVVSIRGNRVRVGIDAPMGVSIFREELTESRCEEPALVGHAD
jgi:carbon storage regulator